METRPVAPGDLALVEDFLRTRNRLADPTDYAAWLASHNLPTPFPLASPFADEDAGRAALREAVALREALRGLAAANNGFPPDPAALAHVNTELDRLAVRPLLTADGTLTWRSAGSATSADTAGSAASAGSGGAALGVLLAAVARAFADGSWPRFKACAADDCRYAFYDHTKNRSARWCDVAGCGVNARMRAYRRRRAGA